MGRVIGFSLGRSGVGSVRYSGKPQVPPFGGNFVGRVWPASLPLRGRNDIELVIQAAGGTVRPRKQITIINLVLSGAGCFLEEYSLNFKGSI